MAASSELVGFVVMLSVPAYFVLQPWALHRFARKWRTAAAAPLLFAIPAALWCLYAFAQGSDLWPITFVFVAPIGTLYLLILICLDWAITP